MALPGRKITNVVVEAESALSIADLHHMIPLTIMMPCLRRAALCYFVLSPFLEVLWIYSEGGCESPGSFKSPFLHCSTKSCLCSLFSRLILTLWPVTCLQRLSTIQNCTTFCFVLQDRHGFLYKTHTHDRRLPGDCLKHWYGGVWIQLMPVLLTSAVLSASSAKPDLLPLGTQTSFSSYL